MAIQTINTGSSANAGDGDSLRSAFAKINSNFAEIVTTLTTSTAGPTGPRGPQGPASTVPGPTGPTGPASTVPGPSGPTGPESTVPGPSGPSGPSGPLGSRYMGPYSSSTTYVSGDFVVGSDNNSYIAVGETTGDDPAVAPNALWDTFVPKGAIGETGPTGPSGVGYNNVYSTNDFSIANTGTLTIYTLYTGSFIAGNRVRVVSTGSSTNWMEGTISSLADNFFIAVDVDTSNGSGTYADWQFTVAGLPGSQGPAGPTGPDANTISFGILEDIPTYTSSGNTLGPATALTYAQATNTLFVGKRYVDGNLYIQRNNYSPSYAQGLTFAQHHETADAVNFSFFRTRGTSTAQTPLLPGDDIGEFGFFAPSTTAAAVAAAGFNVSVDNTATGVPASQFQFFTNNGTSFAERVRITSTGTLRANSIGSLTAGGNISSYSSILPVTDDTYNLGSSSNKWKALYVSTLTIRNSVVTGDYDNDNYSTFKQIENAPPANDGSGFYKVYNFLTEFEQATIITNEDASMNQALILGDTGDVSTATLFGVAVLDNSTGTYLLPTTGTETGWIQKLNLLGNGTLILPTGGLTAAGHLVPSADLTYDLGTTSSQWRSLYVGTSTIYLGGTALSVADGNLTVDGNEVIVGTTSTLATTYTSSNIVYVSDDFNSVTVQTYNTISAGTNVWYFDANGWVTFPDNSIQTTAYRFITPPVSSTSTGVAGALAQDANYLYVCTATNSWQRIGWDTNPW